MRVRHFAFGGGLVAAVLVACGGAITSVDSNKDVSTLPPTDQDQLCHDVANYAQQNLSPTDLKKVMCGFGNASGTTTGDTTACQNAFTACMNDPNKNVNVNFTNVNCTGFDQMLKKCPGVTVGQFSDCYKQEMEVFKVIAAEMPICTKAQMYQVEADVLNRLSGQCLQVMSQCSGTSFMGGGTTGGGGGDPPPAADAGTRD